MEITFLGQSGFKLSKAGSSIIIDPTDKQSGNTTGNLVYCTHDHTDHIGGVSTFMDKNPDALLVANREVANQFSKYSERTVIAEHGGSYQSGDWSLKFIQLRHGIINSINLGVIVSNGENSFGHLGDTVTYEGFYHEKLDTLAIPITGGVTTSPSKALDELSRFDKPLPNIVLMHWVFRNPKNFCKRFKTVFPDSKCIVPKRGQVLPLT